MAPLTENMLGSENEQFETLYKELDKGIHDMEQGNLIAHSDAMELIRSRLDLHEV